MVYEDSLIHLPCVVHVAPILTFDLTKYIRLRRVGDRDCKLSGSAHTRRKSLSVSNRRRSSDSFSNPQVLYNARGTCLLNILRDWSTVFLQNRSTRLCNSLSSKELSLAVFFSHVRFLASWEAVKRIRLVGFSSSFQILERTTIPSFHFVAPPRSDAEH